MAETYQPPADAPPRRGHCACCEDSRARTAELRSHVRTLVEALHQAGVAVPSLVPQARAEGA